MKTPLESISVIAALVIGSISFTAFAGDHEGHNHDKKSVDASIGSTKTFEVSDAHRKEIGLQTQVVETRKIAGAEDVVISVPKTSIIEVSGKTYVFAQSEDNEATFERWEVTTGASDDQFVEAATGVFPGDKLVSSGVASVAQIQSGTYAAVESEVKPAEKGLAPAEKELAEESTKANDESSSTDVGACPLATAGQFTRSRTESSERPECNRRDTSTGRYNSHGHFPRCETGDNFHGNGYQGPGRYGSSPVSHHGHHGHHGHSNGHHGGHHGHHGRAW